MSAGEKTEPPLVDLGNYPVIYASKVAIQKIDAGLAEVALIQLRKNSDGEVERVIVGRVIRPAADMLETPQRVAQILRETEAECGSERAAMMAH